MNTLAKIRQLSISILLLWGASASAAELSKPAERFGPYIALERNADIVKDVKVEKNGRIYILLDPAHKEKEIILKNSSGDKTGYRNWHNGETELISAANQGKAANEYTDWVVTSGKYIEYHMDGKLILHLMKSPN